VIGGLMTNAGVIKTESDVERSIPARGLKLVSRPVDPRSRKIPFRIHVADDLFSCDSGKGSTSESEDSDPKTNSSIAGTSRGFLYPIALAGVAGLLVGYLLTRDRK
jgi:hypothetical protein